MNPMRKLIHEETVYSNEMSPKKETETSAAYIRSLNNKLDDVLEVPDEICVSMF